MNIRLGKKNNPNPTLNPNPNPNSNFQKKSLEVTLRSITTSKLGFLISHFFIPVKKMIQFLHKFTH